MAESGRPPFHEAFVGSARHLLGMSNMLAFDNIRSKLAVFGFVLGAIAGACVVEDDDDSDDKGDDMCASDCDEGFLSCKGDCDDEDDACIGDCEFGFDECNSECE